MGEQSEMLVGPSKESAPVYLAMQSFTLSSVCHPVPNFALRRVLAPCFRRRMAHHDRHYEIENPHQRLGAGGTCYGAAPISTLYEFAMARM